MAEQQRPEEAPVTEDTPMLDLPVFPVDGPLDEQTFFASTPPATGLPACRRLAFGTAGIGGSWGERVDADGVEVLHDVWASGFMLTDSAKKYGRAESIIGQALATWTGDAPVIATKFGDEGPKRDDTPAGLDRHLADSAAKFGGRHPDMVALHEPHMVTGQARATAIEHIRTLLSAGRISAAGLGGGGPEAQKDYINSGVFRYAITFLRVNAVTLQGLADTVPQARAKGVKVFAASPLHMGLLGARYDIIREQKPSYGADVFFDRAAAQRRVAEEAGIAVTQLALRFLLSMPAIDYVLAGASRMSEWLDCKAAYEAGPLPADVYEAVWRNAQQGSEPYVGY